MRATELGLTESKHIMEAEMPPDNKFVKLFEQLKVLHLFGCPKKRQRFFQSLK